MKIPRIKLKDWRNHVETLLVLARLTIIRGVNHSGKSGILQAIEFALTGKCDATDQKGAGMAGLIRQGAERAEILLELAGTQSTYNVHCTVTKRPDRTVHFANPKDEADRGEQVKRWIDDNKPALSCLLNSRYFIGLKPADQKTLLASIIMRPTHDWGEEIRGKCNSVHISSLIPWDRTPFEVIEAAYKAAFEKRTEINRDIKNHRIPDALPVPEGLENLANVNEAREKLNSLRKELNGIIDERRLADKALNEARSRIQALESRIADCDATIKRENELIDSLPGLTPKQVKDFEKTAGNAKKLADKHAEVLAADLEIAGVDSLIALFQKLEGQKCCPTCKRDVTDDFLTEALAPLANKRNDLIARKSDLLKEEAALGNVEEAKRKLDEHKQNETHRKRSQAIIAEKQALARTSRSELDEIRANMPGTYVPDSRQGELEATIEQFEKAIADLAVVDARNKEIERAKETLQRLTAASNTLESLVSYFGKDGIKAKLLAEDIGPFTSAMNEALAGWGYACSFEIEPYGFRITNLMTNATLPIELLSGSERLRFAIAFQVALAQVSGIRLVAIDEADILDTEGRNAFYGLLLEADIDQAIAIGTDEREQVPDVPGAKFYAMDNGQARELLPQNVEA